MSDYLPSTKFINVSRTVTGIVDFENSDQILDCDTTLGPVTINLKKIPANYWSTLTTIYVKDAGNNASVNNITIVAPVGFKINNQQSIVINVNEGSVFIKITSNTDYLAEFNYGIVGNNAIPVKNTVYVMKNGSDTTGLVERFDKPFLTIEAATNAALVAFVSRTVTDRVRIVVEDGNYTDVIALYPYIDYDLGNSVITAKSGSPNLTDANGTFTAQINGQYTNIIYGTATFINTNNFSGFNAHNFYFSKSSKVLLNAVSAYTKNGECAYIINGSQVDFYVRTFVADNVTDSIIVNTIQVAGITGQNPCVVNINNAYITNKAVTTQKSVIMVTNSVGTTNLYHKVSLNNCQISNYSTTSAAIQTFETAGTGDLDLTLINSIIYCANSVPSVSKGTALSNINMYIYNSYANQSLAAAGLAPTVLYGTLNVDPAIIVNQGQPI